MFSEKKFEIGWLKQIIYEANFSCSYMLNWVLSLVHLYLLFQNEGWILACFDLFFKQVVNETIPALQKLKEAGKIRFIGITGLPLEIFTYVLDRVPPGSVDVILSYCHYSINDTTLEDLLPYLKSKGVGVISASPLAMGLLTERGPPEWHPASPELKVFLFTS